MMSMCADVVVVGMGKVVECVDRMMAPLGRDTCVNVFIFLWLLIGNYGRR